MNEIFCPGCGGKACDFVTYCPYCGFDIKKYRQKTVDQQVRAYFAQLYSRAPKNDSGFARNENDVPFPDMNAPAAVPASGKQKRFFGRKTKGYPSDSNSYGDGYYSYNEVKSGGKLSKGGKIAILLTLAIAAVSASVLILISNMSKNDSNNGFVQTSDPYRFDYGLSDDEIELKAGPERYISQDTVRCTITTNINDHIFVVVNSQYNGDNDISFVDVNGGSGEYMGKPLLSILGFVNCDDFISMSMINTGYKYITIGDSTTDCRVEFSIEFNEAVTGLFIYDVEFSDNRTACRSQAVSVKDGKCMTYVTCSDVSDSSDFKATFIPKGFINCDDPLSEKIFLEKMDISFTDYYYYSIAKSYYYADLRNETYLMPNSLILYTYKTTSGGSSGEIGETHYGSTFAVKTSVVPVKFTDVIYGLDPECPEYEVDFFASTVLRGNAVSQKEY